MSTTTTEQFTNACAALAAVLGDDNRADSPWIMNQVRAIADQGVDLGPLADNWWKYVAAKAEQAQEQAAHVAKAEDRARDTATHNLAGASGFHGSPAQFRFIGTLLAEREVTVNMAAWWHAVTIGEAQCDKRGASRFIEALQAQERKAGAKAATDLEPGYYADDDTVYVVVLSKAGRPYAKRWDVAEGQARASWVYAPGAARTIAAKGLAPLTLDQAKEWGHLHGRCIRCGRQLTDPTSVEAGIGPICAGYWG